MVGQVIDEREGISFFAVTLMLATNNLPWFLLSNGNILVLPKGAGYGEIKSPPKWTPTYRPEQIEFLIKGLTDV